MVIPYQIKKTEPNNNFYILYYYGMTSRNTIKLKKAGFWTCEEYVYIYLRKNTHLILFSLKKRRGESQVIKLFACGKGKKRVEGKRIEVRLLQIYLIFYILLWNYVNI